MPLLVRLLGLDVLDARQAPLALDDAGGSVPPLLLEEVVEATSLVDLRGDVDRARRGNLPAPSQTERELRLLERGEDALCLGDELRLAQPAAGFRRGDEPLRVLRAHVVVDPLLDRLGTELRDRVARVDAFRTALVAEVAARAVPDPVLLVEVVQPRYVVVVAGVSDETHTFGERRGAEEVGVGLHRVALRDAAAAHDAERLLVDDVHRLLRDDALALGDLVVAVVKPGLDGADLVPERIHVDDEVLHDRKVPHRRDDRDVARLDDRLHPLLAGEDRPAVHAHPAGAADHHPAALAVSERPVVAVLDDVEDVEQARPLGRLDLVGAQLALARLAVDAPDLERDVHRRTRAGVHGSLGHFDSLMALARSKTPSGDGSLTWAGTPNS